MASTATASYDVDTNWYVDTGVTDHITSELEKLTVRDKYHGNEQVHTASGSCMKISHVGRSLFHTHDRNLILDKVLHVPQANKNLTSVHRLAVDNHVYLEYYPDLADVKAAYIPWCLVPHQIKPSTPPLRF